MDEEVVDEGGLGDQVVGAACSARDTARQQTGWWRRRRRRQTLLNVDTMNLKGPVWGLGEVMKPRKWTLPGESGIYGC